MVRVCVLCTLTETRFVGCWVFGHTVACILAILVSITVLARYKKNILEMRRGKSPFTRMLSTTPQSKFSNASTPAVGGMVRLPRSRISKLPLNVQNLPLEFQNHAYPYHIINYVVAAKCFH